MIRIDDLNTLLLRSRTPSAGDQKRKKEQELFARANDEDFLVFRRIRASYHFFLFLFFLPPRFAPPRPAASASFVFKSCSCGTGGWFAV